MSHEDRGQQDTARGAAQARASFERAVESLDVGTINRLRLFRRETLTAAPRRPRGWLLPVGAVAAAVVALALVWRTPRDEAPVSSAAPSVVEDQTPLEFPSEEEAELYAWLGDAPVATAEGSTL